MRVSAPIPARLDLVIQNLAGDLGRHVPARFELGSRQDALGAARVQIHFCARRGAAVLHR